MKKPFLFLHIISIPKKLPSAILNKFLIKILLIHYQGEDNVEIRGIMSLGYKIFVEEQIKHSPSTRLK